MLNLQEKEGDPGRIDPAGVEIQVRSADEDDRCERHTFDKSGGEQHVGEDLTLHFWLTGGGFTGGATDAADTKTGTQDGKASSQTWDHWPRSGCSFCCTLGLRCGHDGRSDEERGKNGKQLVHG
jgi:hypothetical protein